LQSKSTALALALAGMEKCNKNNTSGELHTIKKQVRITA
jgi:hypothetical protein